MIRTSEYHNTILNLRNENKLWCESTTNPVLVLRVAASRSFSELTKNVIRSSHGHSTPSLKVSCKSVQPFFVILLTKKERERKKETKKDTYIHTYSTVQTKKSIENNTPSSIYRGRFNYGYGPPKYAGLFPIRYLSKTASDVCSVAVGCKLRSAAAAACCFLSSLLPR